MTDFEGQLPAEDAARQAGFEVGARLADRYRVTRLNPPEGTSIVCDAWDEQDQCLSPHDRTTRSRVWSGQARSDQSSEHRRHRVDDARR